MSGQKGSSSKAVDCKDRAEILIAEKEQKNKKDWLGPSREVVCLHSLQPQNCKSERLCFEKKKPQSTNGGIENLFFRARFPVSKNPAAHSLQP